MKKNTEDLKKLAADLLRLMSVEAGLEVSFDKDQDAFLVNIDAGEATGLLIGRKGETLASLQTILGVMLKQNVGEWKRVIINVGDYREKEEDYLKNLAVSAAGRAKETGEPQSLYNLKAWQRRVIHMFLSDDPGIMTESVGEGEERYLVIKPRK